MKKNGTYESRKLKISQTLTNLYSNDIEKSNILELRFNTLKDNYGELGYSHPDILKKQYDSKLKNNTLPSSENVVNKMFETKKRNGTLPGTKEITEKMLKTLKGKGPEYMKEINRKRNETFKKNKTYTKSKPANLFFEIFNKYFDFDREYQIYDNKSWFIDFYSKKYDFYIQFDGDYWHGLNKTDSEIQNILNQPKKNDRVINHIFADRKQNDYFEKNNLFFIRISEKYFYNFLKQQWPHIKNPLKSGNIQLFLDNPELAFNLLIEMSHFKSNATTIESILNKSDKSNLEQTSRVDLKEDRNRGILINTENLLKQNIV
jgi:hypothetical protein